MTPTGFFSGIVIGLLIGALARIVVHNSQPLGCLLTLIIGVVGGTIGAAIAGSQGWGFWITVALQILIAAVIVVIFSVATRPPR
ncbi:MAG: GlsB/YeaQ/YmgE family stress response membrane protein [Actinomycetes bacterium]